MLSLGLCLRQSLILIFSRCRKNSRKAGIKSCHALDEVEEGGTNLREWGVFSTIIIEPFLTVYSSKCLSSK
jgi:hypothetical protein